MAKNSINQWTLTILRVVLGVIFAYHGYVKLFVKGALPGTAQFFSAIGIPLANYAAVLVAFVEFFGGLALILGVFTRWVSVLLILEMLVALFKVHLKQGFFITPKAYGYEFLLLILAALVVVLANGAGKLSLGKLSLGKLFKSKNLQ